jgi:hypothetical protein
MSTWSKKIKTLCWRGIFIVLTGDFYSTAVLPSSESNLLDLLHRIHSSCSGPLRAVSGLPSCSLRAATMRSKNFQCSQGCKKETTGKLKQCLGEQVPEDRFVCGECSGDLAIFGDVQRSKWDKSKQGGICARKSFSTRKTHFNPILRVMNFLNY